VLGCRFEVPNRFRHLRRLRIRYARWNMSTVDMVDPRDRAQVLCTLYPLDKTKNADGLRRRLVPLDDEPRSDDQPAAPVGMAPLLRKLMADYAATGLPPAYLADHRGGDEDGADEDPDAGDEENHE
jgi:hypothetical protein